MAEVRVENLTKCFDEVVAVNNLNLTIADRELLVLLGPSGCGKTTTLRSIAGLERQTSGNIYIGDRLVNDLSPANRDIAMVFQFYALYPHMSAYDNLAFPLRAQRLPTAEVEERVRNAARVLRIDHILYKKPRQMSSGEQQRVALGRAMVRDPKAFLMDEPLTNLDASLRADMRAELKHLQNQLGTTMIHVTHDQIEAMNMGDRIAVMHLGVLQQVGTPLEVYDHPANLFVAGFIGSPPMNIFDCVLTDGEEPALADIEGTFRLHIPLEASARIRREAAGRELVLGIRPEDIHVVGATEQRSVGAETFSIEPLGDENIYGFQVGARLLRARTEPTLRLRVGEQVRLHFDLDRLHVFDKATEKAII
jgi:multiple sugar transport system ATP-binding protein